MNPERPHPYLHLFLPGDTLRSSVEYIAEHHQPVLPVMCRTALVLWRFAKDHRKMPSSLNYHPETSFWRGHPVLLAGYGALVSRCIREHWDDPMGTLGLDGGDLSVHERALQMMNDILPLGKRDPQEINPSWLRNIARIEHEREHLAFFANDERLPDAVLINLPMEPVDWQAVAGRSNNASFTEATFDDL